MGGQALILGDGLGGERLLRMRVALVALSDDRYRLVLRKACSIVRGYLAVAIIVDGRQY
jgi:hypothetical protein